MMPEPVPDEEIDILYERLNREAEQGGYHLNPDIPLTRSLIEGLITNEKRYGYPSCPCRLASGKKEEDLDIICPCDYRDPDLTEHGACYCALYVSADVMNGKKEVCCIPERRPPLQERRKVQQTAATASMGALPFPVYRCSVCGYLCARKNPPEVCPICKAKKERFERFL